METNHVSAGATAQADDIPLIVKLVENPKFDLPFVDIFKGAIGLKEHDLVHALLGRGMLPADEAFAFRFQQALPGNCLIARWWRQRDG